MGNSLYLIRNKRDDNTLFYAEHGEMGGVPDAIGYDSPEHARKFRTREEAQAYIDPQIPEWGRRCHQTVQFEASYFTWNCWGITSMLHACVPIPDHLMLPTPGRLRIWRR